MSRLYWLFGLWYIRLQIEKAVLLTRLQKWIERELS